MNIIINSFLSLPYQVYIVFAIILFAIIIRNVQKVIKQCKDNLPMTILNAFELIVIIILIPITKNSIDTSFGRFIAFSFFLLFIVSLIVPSFTSYKKYKRGNMTPKEIKDLKLNIFLTIVAFALYAVVFILDAIG